MYDWWDLSDGDGGATAVAVTAGAAQATAEAAAAAAAELEEDLEEQEEELQQLQVDLEAFKTETLQQVERLWSETWKGVSWDTAQAMIQEAVAPLIARLESIEGRVEEWQARSTTSSASTEDPGIQVEPPALPEKPKGLLASIFLTPR